MTARAHSRLLWMIAGVIAAMVTWAGVGLAYIAPQPSPSVPRRAPISSITPTDPMAR